MFKKISIFLAVVLIALFATYKVVGNSIEKEVTAYFASSAIFDVKKQDFHKGFMHSNGTTTIVITKDRMMDFVKELYLYLDYGNDELYKELSENKFLNNDLEVVVNYNLEHSPLNLSSGVKFKGHITITSQPHLEIAKSLFSTNEIATFEGSGLLDEIDQKIKLKDLIFPMQQGALRLSTKGLTFESQTTSKATKSLKIKADDISLISPLVMVITKNFNYDVECENGVPFERTKHYYEFLLNDNVEEKLSIDSFGIVGFDNNPDGNIDYFNMIGIKTKSNYSFKNGIGNQNASATIESMLINLFGADPVILKDFDIKSSLIFTPDNYIKFMKLFMETTPEMSENFDEMMDYIAANIPQIFSKDRVIFNIDQFKFKLADDKELNIVLNYSFNKDKKEFSTFDEKTLISLSDFYTKIELNSTLEELAKKHKYDSLAYLFNDFFIQTKNKSVLTIKLDSNANVLVNDEVIGNLLN